MTWQDLGSVGEIVGAVAVVLSLAYLAHQIRQNTRQIDQNTKAVRAAAIDSSVGHAMAVRQAVFENQDVARIYVLGSADPKALSAEELVRYRLLIHNVLWSIWNIFSQSRYAELASETWDAQIPLLQRVLCSKGGEWFWSQYRNEFEASFQLEIERVVRASMSSNDQNPDTNSPAV